jgi:hypothetical protein
MARLEGSGKGSAVCAKAQSDWEELVDKKKQVSSRWGFGAEHNALDVCLSSLHLDDINIMSVKNSYLSNIIPSLFPWTDVAGVPAFTGFQQAKKHHKNQIRNDT